MRRGTAVMLAALMSVLGAVPAFANERVRDERPAVEMVDRSGVQASDRAIDQVRPIERDAYRCVDLVTDRRCIDDRHPHVNIRHLIQRLINAGEWEKLFRLLHRLGII